MSEKPALFSTLPVIRHSFATPVTNILLNAQIAADTLTRRPHQPSAVYLQRVVLNAQYLQSVLTLADSDQPEVFSPQTALDELIALNEGTQLKESLVSRLFLEPDCQLQGSKLSFQETTVCLLNNAFESYEQRHWQKLVFLSASQADGFLTLVVADGGRGMNWLTQKLSTTQTYSTKKRHAGLGLHFAKHAVEREFGGRLHLTSRPGRGTTVRAVFPIVDHQAIAKAAASFQY